MHPSAPGRPTSNSLVDSHRRCSSLRSDRGLHVATSLHFNESAATSPYLAVHDPTTSRASMFPGPRRLTQAAPRSTVAGDRGERAHRAENRIAQTRVTRFYCAVATIRYSDVDSCPEDANGVLLYIKPAILGRDEPRDVLQYSAANKAFPHQSTVDQLFDESQFES